MKKIITVVFFFISTITFAQRNKEFQIRIGLGVAAYNTTTNINYKINTPLGSIPFTYEDNGGAGTVHLPIELRYEITRRFNIGLDMKFGSYLYEDNEDNTKKSNAFRSLGLGLEFVILNRENTRLYAGFCFNSTLLEMSEIIKYNNNTETITMTWRGPGARLSLGFMQYFGSSPLGINVNAGLTGHNFDLKDWKYPSPTSWINLGTSNGNLNASGIDLTLGLVFRIRQ